MPSDNKLNSKMKFLELKVLQYPTFVNIKMIYPNIIGYFLLDGMTIVKGMSSDEELESYTQSISNNDRVTSLESIRTDSF